MGLHGMAGDVANDHASLPIAYRLYLPEDWASEGHFPALR